jgi:lipopolysaccharide heptosyltransferase II
MQPLTLNANARLLIARPDRVGDVIISTSCLAPLRRAFPRGEIFFLAAERMRPLLENHPDLTGFISDAAQIASLKADAIVHLHPDKEYYRAAAHTAIPIRIGYRQKSLGKYLTHSPDDRREEGLKHEAAYSFDLLQLIGVPPPARLEPNVHLPESALSTLRAKLPWPLESTPFAVLNPSAHSPVARWPMKYFLQLADKLQGEHGLLPVFIGADTDDSLNHIPFLSLAGKTDLAELGWLLKHARVLVTRDTGPSHLAAAVGCPVVVIFGRTAPIYGPTRWRPLTEKAVIVTKPVPRKRWESQEKYWRRSFAAIQVDEVEAAVRQMLTAWAR